MSFFHVRQHRGLDQRRRLGIEGLLHRLLLDIGDSFILGLNMGIGCPLLGGCANDLVRKGILSNYELVWVFTLLCQSLIIKIGRLKVALKELGLGWGIRSGLISRRLYDRCPEKWFLLLVHGMFKNKNYE